MRLQVLGDVLRLQVLHALAVRQRVGLGEEVAHQLVVVAHRLALALQRRLALAEADEVARDHATLVDQLVETVLAVGARLAEVHLARGERERRAVHGHALSVRLHVHLLDVRGEAKQRLRVGQKRAARVLEEGRVPDADQTHHGGNVLGLGHWTRNVPYQLGHAGSACRCRARRPKSRSSLRTSTGGKAAASPPRTTRYNARRPSPRTQTCSSCRCRTR